MTKKMLVSLPEDLYQRVQKQMPLRSRSKIIAELIKEELKRREDSLFKIACAVEQNVELSQEMSEIENEMHNDGLDDYEWKQ